MQSDNSRQNVTLRKGSGNRRHSHEEILNALNISDVSANPPLSLPDLSDQLCESTAEFQELKNRILILETQLESAHIEIDSLSTENNLLKKQLLDRQKKTNLLKRICSETPTIYRTPRSSHRKRELTPKRLIIGNTWTPGGRDYEEQQKCEDGRDITDHPQNRSEPAKIEEIDLKTKQHEEQKSRQEYEIKPNQDENLNLKRSDNLKSTETPRTNGKHRVMLFADERGHGIRESIQDLLGQDFTVTSLIKTNATSDQVVSSCLEICRDYTEEDYVVFLLGTNDKNPIKMQSHLYHIMSLLRTNVLLGTICWTRFLNEKMMNKMFKFLCTQFDHATFVDLTQQENNVGGMTRIPRRLTISRQILREILRITNKTNHRSFLIKSKQNKQSVTPHLHAGNIPISSPIYNNNSCSHQPAILQKGTIPYFFQRNTQKKTVVDHKIVIKQSDLPKMGTIPYYFTNKTKASLTTNNTQFFRS